MKTWLGLIGLAVALTAVGCGKSSGEEPGYSKADFAKTPPPANWPHGPGGAPPSGPPPGPPPGIGGAATAGGPPASGK